MFIHMITSLHIISNLGNPVQKIPKQWFWIWVKAFNLV